MRKGVITIILILMSLSVASQVKAVNWSYIYLGDRKPNEIDGADSWILVGNDNADTSIPGVLTLNDVPTPDTGYYRRNWNAYNSIGTTTQVRVKIDSGSGANHQVHIDDGTKKEALLIAPTLIQLQNAGLFYSMDTTDTYHTYRIIAQGGDISVYVDDDTTPKIEALFTTDSSDTQIYFGDNDNTDSGVSHWDYVKYSIEGAIAPSNPPSAINIQVDDLQGLWQVSGDPIRDNQPRIRWTFSDPDAGDTQVAYQVQIDDNGDFSSPEVDEGEIVSQSSSYLIPYPSPLSQDGTYYVRVRLEDSTLVWGDYSTPVTFVLDTTPPGSGVNGSPVNQSDNPNWRSSALGGDNTCSIYIGGNWIENSDSVWVSTEQTPAVRVYVVDKNNNAGKEDQCSGLNGLEVYYRYSTGSGFGVWTSVDSVDTGFDGAKNIYKYLQVDNVPFNQDSKTDNKIQFKVEDKVGNIGYSHVDDSGDTSLTEGFVIQIDTVKPITEITSRPANPSYSTAASFTYQDTSVHTSYTGFKTRLERSNSGTFTGEEEVVYNWTPYQPWPPGFWSGSSSYANLEVGKYYRFRVKGRDEAFNEEDTDDSYIWRVEQPYPDTVIYEGPSGDWADTNITFKWKGTGGTGSYQYSYELYEEGTKIESLTDTTVSSLSYTCQVGKNYYFKVWAKNDTFPFKEDPTPATRNFTIIDTSNLPGAISPSKPIKFWREMTE